MNDLDKAANADPIEVPFSEEQVVDYLLTHPEFFVHQPQIITELEIPHSQKGAVSLVERQLDGLREQNQSLKKNIRHLMETAARNETIYRVYSELYIELLKCEQMSQVQQTLKQHLSNKLELPVVQLRLVADKSANHGQLQLVHDDAEQVITRRLRERPFYFGRLTQKENWLLFGEQPVESVALMLLGNEQAHAILAIGSDDASRFQPDMDGLLLEQLRALLTTLMPKLLQLNTADEN